MKINRIHNFDLSLDEARRVQIELCNDTIIANGPRIERVKLVAGCDVAFDKNENLAFGALVFLDFPSLKIVRKIVETAECKFPYIPGFLSFREMDILLKMFEKSDLTPDLVLVDGQGIAHPRGFGIASHLGVFLKIPAIGCAKSRLVGSFDEPDILRGARSSLVFKGKKVGEVLRTKNNVKPIFVSPGHLVGIENATELALACVGKYRIPEPTRQAHIAAGELKKSLRK
jgi:deoxyribonuclease V